MSHPRKRARIADRYDGYPGFTLEPGHIRLIRLHSGDWNDPIRCSLFEVRDNTVIYQALSYVWGPKHVTRPIYLQGRKFPVTVNLESALRHLRERLHSSSSEEMVLWIDALCINQDDVVERAGQVQLMGSIYRRCQEVIVYLGDRINGSAPKKLAPALLHFEDKDSRLNERVEERTDMDIVRIVDMFRALREDKHLHEIEVLNGDSRILVPDNGSVPKSQTKHLGFFEALRRMMHAPFTPWWSRIWVVQESVLPPKVLIVYGTVSAPWDLFAEGSTNCTKHGTTCCSELMARLPHDEKKVLNDCCNRISITDELRKGRSVDNSCGSEALESREAKQCAKDWSLIELLHKFRDRKTTDTRDKVYALLGIASQPPWVEPLLPDYRLTDVEVFGEATLHCIYETQSLSVFSTDLGRKFRNDLPSWVPDWGAPEEPLYAAREAALNLYNSCPSGPVATPDVVRLRPRSLDQKPLYLHRLDQSALDMIYDRYWSEIKPLPKRVWLEVVGLKMGSIDQVDEIMLDGNDSTIRKGVLRSWLHACTKHDANPSWIKCFLRTICADVLYDSDVTRPRRSEPDDELSLMLWALESVDSPMNPTDACWQDIVHRLKQQFIPSYGSAVSPEASSHKQQLQVISTSVRTATFSRRLMMSGRHIGLGPARARAGDELYFLKGGRTPYVLRRAKPQQRQMRRERRDIFGNTHGNGLSHELVDPEMEGVAYEIVGDCYIHALMDAGERNLETVREWEGLTLV